MKNIKAIFYQVSLKDFMNFCDKNNIDLQEWTNDCDGYISELRIDLYDLDKSKFDLLEFYLGSNEFIDYDYLIAWE